MIARVPALTAVTATNAVTLYPDGRMDTRNAALYMGLAPKTLAMMRCNGTGPAFIKRGRVFYFREDVDAWLNAQGRLMNTAQSAQRPRDGR